MGRFPEVDTALDLPALDRRVLQTWHERGVFARSLEIRAGAEPFVFYEGPPTANAAPGVHHVEPRVFKDVFPRFQTMRGRRVERKGGWDCHGLPVELQIERELGLAHKRDIEAYGIEAFNARCRAAVERHVGDFETLTERIGFWVDLKSAYWTMDTSYIESVWWALAELFRRGLLFEDDKVVPYCPRCGTALSDAEVALGYEEVDDPSAYVVLPVTSGDLEREQAGLLVWTTTPWTLVSNAGVVVGPDIDYVLAEAHGPGAATWRVVVAAALLERALGAEAHVLRPVPIEELVGTTYRRPFDLVAVNDEDAERGWRVVTADYVTTGEGTGLVHAAPAFGAEDMAVGRREGLPVLRPVDGEGRFVDGLGFLSGQQVKAADAAIIEDLRERGLLWRAEPYRHDYPHCWRCQTPLLYYAQTSWFARTTAVRERMLAENARVVWQPEHIRDGRFGDWLEHNVDWALSRARYWGTPLPLWRCGSGHVTAVASLAELGEHAGRDLRDLDPHRPYVDAVTFACPSCGEEAARVPDVIDAWFDSGCMPFAQWGYPHHGSERLARAFPADFIAEAIDQTRGWFYSLLANSTLLFDQSPYRTVVCLGHIVDADGRKMSKSVGNVLEPMELLDRYGADPLRWFMLASGSPWGPRRLSGEVLEDITRSFFLTLWNTYAFFTLYAGLEGFDPSSEPTGGTTALDDWAMAELADTLTVVTAALEDYDPATAGRRLERFVDDLSNWYVRLSRRRFWRGTDGGDAAFRTLWTCLRGACLLLAPFTPFVAEELWQGLVVAIDTSQPESVHLAEWPTAASLGVVDDPGLREAMAEARRLVGLGRQARTEAKVKVRQPLARALVTVPAGVRPRVAGLLELVARELNVKEVAFAEGTAGTVGWKLSPEFRVLGPRFGKHAQAVAAAVRSADAAVIGPQLQAGATVTIEVGPLGGVELGPAEVRVSEEPVTGWRVATQDGSSVALDLELTPQLRREGLARDLVRAVQDLRKTAGLAVDDRIRLTVGASGTVADALSEHRGWLAAETLAVDVTAAPDDAAVSAGAGAGERARSDAARQGETGHVKTVVLDGQPVQLRVERVSANR